MLAACQASYLADTLLCHAHKLHHPGTPPAHAQVWSSASLELQELTTDTDFTRAISFVGVHSSQQQQFTCCQAGKGTLHHTMSLAGVHEQSHSKPDPCATLAVVLHISATLCLRLGEGCLASPGFVALYMCNEKWAQACYTVDNPHKQSSSWEECVMLTCTARPHILGTHIHA